MNILFEKRINYKDRYLLNDYGKGDIIPLVSDTMFHVMLNNESRKQYAAYLLSLILKEDYQEIFDNISFSKSELEKEKYHTANKTVDLVCKIKGKVYNIEMNNNSDLSTLERNIDYANQLYASSRRRGKKYQFTPVVQININNFSFEGNDKVMDDFYLKSEDDIILTDKIRIIYLYLPNIRRKYYNKEKLSDIDKLLLIFNEKDSKKLSELYRGDTIMNDYRKEALDASEDDEILGLYDKEKEEEMLRIAREEEYRVRWKKEGLEEGRAEGLVQGKQQAKIEMIKSLFQNNVPIEIISKSTSLSTSDVEKIIKE